MKKVIFCLFGISLICSAARSQQDVNALHFDAVDDYVDLNELQADFYAVRTHFTIEFWMPGDMAEQTSSIRTCLFSINEPTGENRLLIIMGGPSSQDGKLMICEDGSGSAYPIFTSTDIIGDNLCHHIAYSFDGTTGKVYIDGILKDSHAVAYPITKTATALGRSMITSRLRSFTIGRRHEFKRLKTFLYPNRGPETQKTSGRSHTNG